MVLMLTPNEEGKPALMKAAETTQVMLLLLAKEANVNLQDSAGQQL